MELAYRLAVDESPYVRNIRDRMVHVFNWKLNHPGETGPGLLYRGHYVAHDNNRDAMGMTLKLTQNVLDTNVGLKPQVLHDLHESGSFL